MSIGVYLKVGKKKSVTPQISHEDTPYLHHYDAFFEQNDF